LALNSIWGTGETSDYIGTGLTTNFKLVDNKIPIEIQFILLNVIDFMMKSALFQQNTVTAPKQQTAQICAVSDRQ